VRRRVWLFALLLLAATGCARVEVYERGYLSDPIMDLELQDRRDKQDQKWLEAREGSTGGAAGAGGGCACS
jgi:hypothetical protein